MKMISRNRLAVIKKRESEPWIYSYADLVTNLLAFFMMLLIISTSKTPEMTQQQLVEGIKNYVQDKVIGRKARDGTPPAELSISEMQQMIDQYIRDANLESSVSLTARNTGLELTFEGSTVFDRGTSQLRPESEPVLAHIASLLQKLPGRFIIDVEGHADNKPIPPGSGGRYPSNWELSSARAGSVVRFFELRGLKPTKMRAIGYASTRPIDGSGDSEANRRVVVKVNSEVEY
jgi:chemotaxis protein MotB